MIYRDPDTADGDYPGDPYDDGEWDDASGEDYCHNCGAIFDGGQRCSRCGCGDPMETGESCHGCGTDLNEQGECINSICDGNECPSVSNPI